MANTYLLVLLIGAVALITPSLAHFHKPSHHNHISPAFSPKPAPEHNPHFHKPTPPKPGHEHKHPKEEHKPLTPAEPPKSGFFPPTHKPLPLPHHGDFPAHPPVKSGEGPHMPPHWRKPPTAHHMAPPPIHAY